MLSTRLAIVSFLAAAWCCVTCEGELYNVACPGENNQLECRDGVIEVLKVDYGDKSNVDCSDGHHPAEISEKKCLHSYLLPWAKFVCDKLKRCRLPKPDKRMFYSSCNDAEDKFIQVTYRCLEATPSARNVVACEGKDAELKCENGKMIGILKANYGRLDEHTCATTPSIMTFCAATTAQFKVAEECEGKSECKIPATSHYLGKPIPCDENPKYLYVDYVCE